MGIATASSGKRQELDSELACPTPIPGIVKVDYSKSFFALFFTAIFCACNGRSYMAHTALAEIAYACHSISQRARWCTRFKSEFSDSRYPGNVQCKRLFRPSPPMLMTMNQRYKNT